LHELWSWEKCGIRIRDLRGRLGFKEDKHLRFLGFKLNLQDGCIFDELNDDQLILEDNYLSQIYCILYSYSNAKEHTEIGKLITSKQLQGGKFCNVMVNRAKSKITETFGDCSKCLVGCANLFGGMEVSFSHGDCSIRINALPLIPFTIVLYEEDYEFPASTQIFFDVSIKDYLDLEKAGMLSELVADRLKEAYQKIYQKN
jgi:hypothetical protein